MVSHYTLGTLLYSSHYKADLCGCPLSRARCRRGRRSSCSTSAPPDSYHHGCKTLHTRTLPWGGRSGPVSLRETGATVVVRARVEGRLRVLAAALTCVWRGALMTTAVEAALLTAGTVVVAGAEFRAHSHAPGILGTRAWFICRGRRRHQHMFISTFREFDRKKKSRQ